MAASLWPNQVTFIAVLCISTGASASHVPLLIWSSDSLPPVAPPAAGHITSSSELGAFLSSALSSGTHTVLLFLQDKLSQDDFTRYGGVFGNKEDSAFKNTEAALQSHSVVFPALEWTGSSAVPALLAEKLGVSPALVAPETLPDLQMDSSVNHLFLLSMPYCGPDKPCRETLRENDETIGHVLKTLEDKKVAYIALFTGVQPSRVIAELSLAEGSMGRSLLQAPAPSAVPPPIMFNMSGSPCIMLWAKNLNVSFTEPESWTDLGQQTPTLTGSFCNASNSVLVLTYTGGITLSFIMSQRFYPVSARSWFTLDRVLLQLNSVTVSFSSRHVSAPGEYSYHCQSVNSFRDALLTPINTTTAWKVNFIDFQIQGFSLNNGTSFSYASDCAGFFTPGIWMGLLTSLLMLWIFVYGLNMILQLNTMDRFDDPKGPCISVPQTE